MQVTLISTKATKVLNGTLCRVWEGETSTGVKCYALIPQIAHHTDDDHRASEFFADLMEHEDPSRRAIECFDLRMVL